MPTLLLWYFLLMTNYSPGYGYSMNVVGPFGTSELCDQQRIQAADFVSSQPDAAAVVTTTCWSDSTRWDDPNQP